MKASQSDAVKCPIQDSSFGGKGCYPLCSRSILSPNDRMVKSLRFQVKVDMAELVFSVHTRLLYFLLIIVT